MSRAAIDLIEAIEDKIPLADDKAVVVGNLSRDLLLCICGTIFYWPSVALVYSCFDSSVIRLLMAHGSGFMALLKAQGSEPLATGPGLWLAPSLGHET